jgi:hypothetical protein
MSRAEQKIMDRSAANMIKLSKFFYSPTNAQVIVLKTILNFTLK